MILIILSCVAWLAALWALCGRQIIAPVLSFAGLCLVYFAKINGYPAVPMNGTILTAWFCMTLVVTFIVMLQPEPVRRQTRGAWYMTIGALTGLAVGLLGFTFVRSLSLLYAVMIIGVIVGIYCGFLLYTRTPEGEAVRPGSGNFFRYLLAKGFPTAITVMQPGVVLVLTIALYGR